MIDDTHDNGVVFRRIVEDLDHPIALIESPAGSVARFSDFRLSLVNSALAKLVGQDVASLVGRSPRVLLRLCEGPRCLATATARLANREAANIPLKPHVRGAAAMLRISPLSDTGAPDAAWLVEIRRRADTSDRSAVVALNAVPDGIARFDEDMRFVGCNQTYRQFYEGIADMLVAGTPLREIVRVDAERGNIPAAAGNEGPWLRQFFERTGADDAVFEQARSDGRWLRLSKRSGERGGTVFTVVDITDAKQRERSLTMRVTEMQSIQDRLQGQGDRLAELADHLKLARDEAEQANRTKSEFLANMSHELRSPLNAVIGFSEMMMNELLGPVGNAQYVEYSRDIHASGSHLLQVINDILDLSKVEAGKLELAESRVDPLNVVHACIRLTAGRSDEAGVGISTQLPNELPLLLADERKLKQVLLNILSNAVKFTPEGGKVIVAAAVDELGDLLLTVSDTGIGMSPEEIPVALSPFGQVDSTFSRRYEGTGLGLPLCKALVELHDGELAVKSTKGEGTTVTVRVPAERVVQSAFLAAGRG